MDVIAVDPVIDPAGLPAYARSASLAEALPLADVVVLVLPLTPETRYIVGAPELALMKPTAYLVNVGRGGLIDEAALLASLEAGRLGGAGLDVWEQEPPDPAGPLLAMPNVVGTAHALARTHEALARICEQVVFNTQAALAGRPMRDVLNPEAQGRNSMNLRQRLRHGEELLCFSVNFPSSAAVEMGAIAGFDFYNIDTEHGPMDIGVIDEMVRAADSVGVPPIVRPPNNDPDTILRILDVGAAGIMAPGIASKADAQALVDAVKYPPIGHRGLGIVRANRWGDEPAAESTRRANEETVIIPLIEDIAAVEAIDEILEVEELDVIWIGPADLSQSMGLTGQYGHPRA